MGRQSVSSVFQEWSDFYSANFEQSANTSMILARGPWLPRLGIIDVSDQLEKLFSYSRINRPI